MGRKSSAYAYLIFWGKDFSPQEFSSFIGLQPTSSGIKGEKGDTGNPHKECFWEFKLSKTDDCAGLDQSLERLRAMFAEQVEPIRKFTQLNHMEVRCIVVLTLKENENPGLRLSASFIQFLTKLGADFELDGYQ